MASFKSLDDFYPTSDLMTVKGCKKALHRLLTDDPVDQDMVFNLRTRLARCYHAVDQFHDADAELAALVDISKSRYGLLHETTAITVKQRVLYLCVPTHPNKSHWTDAESLVRRFEQLLDNKIMQATTSGGDISDTSIRDILDIALCHVLIHRANMDDSIAIEEKRAKHLECVVVSQALLQRLRRTRWRLHTDFVIVLGNLSTAFAMEGSFRAGLELENERAAIIKERYFDVNTNDLLHSLTNCALLNAQLGYHSRAEEIFRECISRWATYQSEQEKNGFLWKIRPQAVQVISYLGKLLEHQGRYRAARDLGLPHYEELISYGHVSTGCVPSFCPESATWLHVETSV